MVNSAEICQYVQNSQQINQKIYEEKLNYEIERVIHNNTYVNENEYFDLKIRRLIQTNKVILEFEHRNLDFKIGNHILKATIANQEFVFNLIHQHNGVYKYQAILELQTSWKQFNYEKLRNICIDIYNQENKKQPVNHLYTINYKFQQEALPLQIRVSEAIHFKLLTLIHYRFYNVGNLEESIKANSDLQFLNVMLVPTKLEIAKYINSLYKVYMYKKWENQTHYIPKLDQTDYQGFNLKSDSINNNQADKFILQAVGENKIEEIKINSYSYFDKETKKTLINPNHENAKQGYILPLNFAGNFNHKCLLTFGEGIKNIELNYNQLIMQPFFDFNNGRVKLFVNSSDNFKLNDKKWSLIKQNNIKTVIEKAKTLLDIEKLGEL